MSKELTPLEALEYLEDIAYDRKMEYKAHDLKKIIEKALKSLEIIKEKQVDIKWCGSLPPFLMTTYAISQEEYNLLKEVLEDEYMKRKED